MFYLPSLTILICIQKKNSRDHRHESPRGTIHTAHFHRSRRSRCTVRPGYDEPIMLIPHTSFAARHLMHLIPRSAALASALCVRLLRSSQPLELVCPVIAGLDISFPSRTTRIRALDVASSIAPTALSLFSSLARLIVRELSLRGVSPCAMHHDVHAAMAPILYILLPSSSAVRRREDITLHCLFYLCGPCSSRISVREAHHSGAASLFPSALLVVCQSNRNSMQYIAISWSIRGRRWGSILPSL